MSFISFYNALVRSLGEQGVSITHQFVIDTTLVPFNVDLFSLFLPPTEAGIESSGD